MTPVTAERRAAKESPMRMSDDFIAIIYLIGFMVTGYFFVKVACWLIGGCPG